MSGQRDFRLLLAGSLATFGNYGLLLPVVPLWAEEGGAGPAGVGATNAAFLIATVAAQLVSPLVLRLLGHRESLVLGGLLLGLPVFAYPATAWLPALVVVSATRGLGFALVVVTGSALVARLLPAHRRGRGVGLYGLSVGLPSVVFLPAGPWLSDEVSFPVVFMLGGALPLVGAAFVFAMRVRTRQSGAAPPQRGRGTRRSPVRLRDLLLPSTVMFSLAFASSAYVTFLPAAIDHTVAVAAGLAGFSLAWLSGRWVAGQVTDRTRGPTLLVPGTVVGGIGMLVLVPLVGVHGGVAITVGCAASALVFGVGFGAVQNTTLTASFDRVDPRGYDVASTVWNIAVDAGTGFGSLALGFLAASLGYPAAFGITAALLACTIPLAAVVSRQERKLR